MVGQASNGTSAPMLLAWPLYLLSLLSVKSQSGPRWWDNGIIASLIVLE